MGSVQQLIDDAFCPFQPLWRSLLIVEFAFLVLLAISVALSPGEVSVAVPFSLLFILPTMVGIIGLIYYCERQ